jgi:hypothetical protein
VQWNGTDNRGTRVPAGVYVCRLATDGAVQTKRVVVIH